MWSNFLEKTWWIWLIAVIMLFIVGVQKCSDANSDLKTENGDGFNVVVVDNCEYIVRISGYNGFMAHKGNCKFCKERNEHMVDSIVSLKLNK